MAGVRDLLPRIYVELAILKSQRFVEDNGITVTLDRIAAAIRGIGDPLAATYARCYLARRGVTCAPTYTGDLELS